MGTTKNPHRRPWMSAVQRHGQNVFHACAELGLAADIGHIRDMKEHGKLGVAITPAVIVDGKVLVAGRVPTVAELKGLLSKL